MMDMTNDSSLFSGNVYFSFDTILINITHYMDLEHIQISFQE